MYLLRGRTPSQMMSFVLQTENGQLFVIDGGVRGDAEALLALLRKLGGPHPVIEGWFLTHVHEDHIAALTSILESRLNELEIKRLYFHFPERPFIADNEAWEIHTWDEFYAALPITE
ncbi:MAG: MBL fold metallo-hydrolase [Hydrogeniiclostridium mannosilyticum]